MRTEEGEFSFKDFFIPFTTTKAINFIIIIGLVVFFNILFNGFVWDDHSYIIDNPGFQKLNFISLFQKNDFNVTAQYRPIPALYFWLLYSVFKNYAFPYHLIQVIIHLISTSLLLVLFKKYFSQKISFFLSLIFLTHPIQVESVSFIGAAGNIIFFLFGIIALLLSLHYKKSKISLLFIFSSLLFSILTKETGFLFIPVILLSIFFYQKRNVLLFSSLSITTSILYFLIRFLIGGVYFGNGRFVAIGDLTLPERIINIPSIVFYYLKTLIYPDHLAILQHWIIKIIDFQHFYFPLLIDILFFLSLITLGIYLFKTKKRTFNLFLFFLLWFVSGLFMHLQIFPLDMTVADRWFYFPFAGILGLLGIVISIISPKVNGKITLIIGAVIIILFSYRSILRNFNWKDDITLYSHDLIGSENPYGLENNLSYAYIKSRQCQKAKFYAQKSIQTYPTFDNYLNLGVSNFCLKNYEESKRAYLEALKIQDVYLVYERLANLSLKYGDPRENINFIKQKALKKYPEDIKLWIDLSILEYQHGDVENAKIDIQHASLLDPTIKNNIVYVSIMKNQKLNVNFTFGD